jgi:hypothetical protein
MQPHLQKAALRRPVHAYGRVIVDAGRRPMRIMNRPSGGEGERPAAGGGIADFVNGLRPGPAAPEDVKGLPPSLDEPAAPDWSGESGCAGRDGDLRRACSGG